MKWKYLDSSIIEEDRYHREPQCCRRTIEGKVVLDFGGVAELEGFEFMDPNAPAANGQPAAPAGSC